MKNELFHVLLVEENPYIAGVLAQTLEGDFRTTVAASGLDAVRLLTQGERFDAVITELKLAHFGGLELIKLIRTSNLLRNLPLLVLSGAEDSETRIQCLEEGADAYMTKPFNPLEVKAKLRVLLRRAVEHLTPVAEPVADLTLRLQRQDPQPSMWPKYSLSSLLRG